MKKKKLNLPRTRYTAYVASSIDGRISLTNKTSPDWTSSEDQSFFQQAIASFDAVVVGRNTYEAAKVSLRKRDTFVLSSRVASMTHKAGVIFVNPNKINLANLFKDYKAVAVLGGGQVYQTMLDKNLFDEIYVTVEPLIFGRGKEMFVGGSKTAKIRLLSVRKLNKLGTLLLHYSVVNKNK